jgi:hypothetical protein
VIIAGRRFAREISSRSFRADFCAINQRRSTLPVDSADKGSSPLLTVKSRSIDHAVCMRARGWGFHIAFLDEVVAPRYDMQRRVAVSVVAVNCHRLFAEFG